MPPHPVESKVTPFTVFMARSGDRGEREGERGRESVSQGEKEVVHLLDMEDGGVSRVGRRKGVRPSCSCSVKS